MIATEIYRSIVKLVLLAQRSEDSATVARAADHLREAADLLLGGAP